MLRAAMWARDERTGHQREAAAARWRPAKDADPAALCQVLVELGRVASVPFSLCDLEGYPTNQPASANTGRLTYTTCNMHKRMHMHMYLPHAQTSGITLSSL